LCCPLVHIPFSSSTKGACQSLYLTRYQGGSRSAALPLVAERIVCAVMAAQTASPASVRIDSKCPAAPVDSQASK
jgi:hypothetical protein